MVYRGDQRILTTVAVATIVFVIAAAAAGAEARPGVEKPDTEVGAETQAVVVGPVATTPVVYVATGLNFPDALGGGPAAAIADAPVLLVRQDSVPASTATELTRLAPDKIVIVGGEGVVSPVTKTALAAFAPTVERLAGLDRYETAAEVSKANFPAANIFMVYDTSGAKTNIPGTCTAYSGLELPITVPGPGTVVVTANINLRSDHTPQAGTDTTSIYIGTSTTDCASNIGLGGDHSFLAQTQESAGVYFPWLTLRKIMHVDSAGTHTFYATGVTSNGDDVRDFWWGYMDATFIPDQGT